MQECISWTYACRFRDLFDRNAPQSVYDQFIIFQAYNSGFETYRTGTPVQYIGYPAVQPFIHVPGSHRTDITGRIGRWRSEREIKYAQEFQRHGM